MTFFRTPGQRWHLHGLVVLSVFTAACTSIPEEAYRLPSSTLQEREVQTRTFAVPAESEILQASISMLQDMEYNLDAIEYPLGVLTASKLVDADSAMKNVALVAADVALVILSILGGTTPGESLYAGADDQIDLKVTLVVLPSLAHEERYTARITIQRTLYDKSERVKEVGVVTDPIVYQEVFKRLSTALVLEGVRK